MRRIVIGLGKINLVGGHQRHLQLIGQLNEARLGGALRIRAMALQFNIEAVAEQRLEALHQLPRQRTLPLHQRFIDRAIRPAGQANEPRAQPLKHLPGHMRQLAFRRLQIGPARKLHQVAVARFILRQKHQRRQLFGMRLGFRRRISGSRMGFHPQRTADDGLNALVGQRFRKFQRPEKIARVGNGQRRHARFLGQHRHLLDMQRPFRQRIGGMRPQMNEGRSF